MKLLVPGLVGLMLAAAMSVGCGPGLSHRAKAPETSTDVFHAMDAELAHAMIGTTTVTSADALPPSRLPLAPWDDAPPAAVVAVTPTWGAGGEIVGEPAPAGAAPVAEAVAAPAPAAAPVNAFDMHPYD